MFTTGLEKFKKVNENTITTVDEVLLQSIKMIVQYIVVFLLERKLVDNKEQARLEMK